MLLIDFSCEYQILVTPGLLPVRLDSCDCLLHIAIVGEVNLQGFLLSPLGGVCPVTFGRFLHTIDIRVLSPAYPNLLEVVAILTVVQGIDGKICCRWIWVSPNMAAISSYLSLNLVWSNKTLTSELLMMASFTMGESITSFNS